MTDDVNPLFVDATMLLRWKHLAPVGIVRLERLVAAHLRFTAAIGPASYVVWDRGYRPADEHEVADLDELLAGRLVVESDDDELPTAADPGGRSRAAAARRTGFKLIGRLPEHLQPFATQAAWSFATFGVESSRHVKRGWRERRATKANNIRTVDPADGAVRHRVDWSGGADLVALGLGWEYLDHEAMYRLKTEHGVRIHMPAFDLIPVTMPQLNAGQSHLVHRYYAEMAHYADSITSISFSTRDALAEFFESESLPLPSLAVNQLPSIDASGSDAIGAHRFSGEPFVLSVSTIEIRKNHLLLLKIWAECIHEGRTMPRLVIVGRLGWDVTELQKWSDHAPELQDTVSLCLDVDDDELIAMYRDCAFTVFPSRVEGWGLPITESLAYGKACIHSTDPAQLEASQDLMPALHPDDFLGWKAAILELLDEPEQLAHLEQRIAGDYRPRTPDQYCSDFEQILTDRMNTTGTTAADGTVSA